MRCQRAATTLDARQFRQRPWRSVTRTPFKEVQMIKRLLAVALVAAVSGAHTSIVSAARSLSLEESIPAVEAGATITSSVLPSLSIDDAGAARSIACLRGGYNYGPCFWIGSTNCCVEFLILTGVAWWVNPVASLMAFAGYLSFCL
jgi:hypothetical protein